MHNRCIAVNDQPFPSLYDKLGCESVIEQFNGHFKENVLDGVGLAKGLIKKAGMVTAGLISYDAEAISR